MTNEFLYKHSNKSLIMNRKVLMTVVLVIAGLFLVSCNTYYRCPAYGEVKMEKTDIEKV
jgi:hypothetical protein